MHNTSTDAQVGKVVLNVDKLNELRRAHEFDSNVDLARALGVDTATLHRVIKGDTAPSNGFIARMKLLFPSVSLDSLFYVDRLGATAGLVA